MTFKPAEVQPRLGSSVKADLSHDKDGDVACRRPLLLHVVNHDTSERHQWQRHIGAETDIDSTISELPSLLAQRVEHALHIDKKILPNPLWCQVSSVNTVYQLDRAGDAMPVPLRLNVVDYDVPLNDGADLANG